MEDILSKEYARKVSPDQKSLMKDTAWYIPHHGVYYPHKPEKIRIVFDCSAKFMGKSLNDMLYKGPDLTSSLVGILWWEDGNMACKLQEYQMVVHLFGAIWSPACANFALCKTAEENRHSFPTDIISTVKRNFYVHDCLKSLPSELQTVEHVDRS